MAKKALKRVNVKKITRLTTLGVSILAIAILLLTAWFIVKSLNDVSVAKRSDDQKSLKVEGVNNVLLEKVQKFMNGKQNADQKLSPGLNNPFKHPAEPPPAPPVNAPPAPTPPAPPAT